MQNKCHANETKANYIYKVHTGFRAFEIYLLHKMARNQSHSTDRRPDREVNHLTKGWHLQGMQIETDIKSIKRGTRDEKKSALVKTEL